MTLDESIKHEEEIANGYEKNAKHIREKMKSDIALSNADDLDKYAKNHRQIAEWLKDYKRFLEQEPCEDVVSRQAVLEKAIVIPIAQVVTEDEVICRKIVFVDDIENLPPVTPTSSKMEQVEDAISREEAKKKFDGLLPNIGLTGGCVQKMLDELPPIQPKVKAGKWIRQQSHLDYTHTYECSECGRTIYAEDDDLTDFPYCHCGAKMEVE